MRSLKKQVWYLRLNFLKFSNRKKYPKTPENLQKINFHRGKRYDEDFKFSGNMKKHTMVDPERKFYTCAELLQAIYGII